jgi:hypothetical protein
MIENLYWWKDKIKLLEEMNKDDLIQFIQEHNEYYTYCQQHLYRTEDPYHMTYQTLAEFTFYGHIVSNVEIAKMVYDSFHPKLQYNYLQQSLWTICKNAYFPAIEWLQSEHLLERHIDACFIDACCNGHLELSKYLYDVINKKDTEYTLTKAHALSIKRNQLHIAKWLEEK